jgi:hypothetical protein
MSEAAVPEKKILSRLVSCFGLRCLETEADGPETPTKGEEVLNASAASAD